MAKCTMCGKKGLFLILSNDGLCTDCQKSRMAELERKISDKTGILDKAYQEAKTEAQRRLETEQQQLENNIKNLNQAVVAVTAQRDALILERDAAQKNLDSIKNRTEKLKPIAASIKDAYQRWVSGEDADLVDAQLQRLNIEELLPDQDLNCLSIKDLRSRYNALRKQIVDVCTSYESRYTTKANATIYKLMVLGLESELENILYKLQFGKLEKATSAVRELTSKYYQLASDGNQSIAPTLKRFVGQIESLYLEVVNVEYEYYVQRERAKEEQKALKEQMRQEAEERKRLDQERKKVEAEELKYNQEITRITELMQQAHDAELEALRKRLSEVEQMAQQVEEKKAEIINLQNGRAGTVYIISNIGSFGDDVFKIGMTRRLEPQDRVNELGDASVPFPFDVHSFIFSEDAVALESALHKELDDRRVNKVNLRKEFFHVSVDELQKLVERIDPTAPFRVTALAEQYRQSQSMEAVQAESA